MTRLSFRVLCSKWLSPPKRFFGVFPKLFCTFVSESPAVFRVNGCCFRKGSMRVPPTILYICLPNGCCFIKSSLESSANCALHLSPSLLLGSKLRELLTCLNHNHTNPVHRNRPIMLLLLGYSLGFFLHHMATQWCSSQCMSIHVVPILFLTKMRDRLNIF